MRADVLDINPENQAATIMADLSKRAWSLHSSIM